MEGDYSSRIPREVIEAGIQIVEQDMFWNGGPTASELLVLQLFECFDKGALRVRKGKVATSPAKRGLLRRVEAEPEKKKARQ